MHLFLDFDRENPLQNGHDGCCFQTLNVFSTNGNVGVDPHNIQMCMQLLFEDCGDMLSPVQIVAMKFFQYPAHREAWEAFNLDERMLGSEKKNYGCNLDATRNVFTFFKEELRTPFVYCGVHTNISISKKIGS